MTRITTLLLLISMTLAACQSATSPTSQGEMLPPTATSTVAATRPATQTPESKSLTNAPSPGCVVQSPFPTPGPTEQSLFPPLSAKDWAKGPDSATVTFTEYSDFQCPYCALLAPVLAQIQNEYPQDVRIVYRHFPLVSIHDKAALSAQAAEAAGKQGKFWEMHDLLFELQTEWVGLSVDQFQNWLIERAGGLGLNKDRFAADLTSTAIADFVNDAWERGVETGLPGTPSLLIDGQIWPQSLPMSAENIRAIVELKKLEKRQFTSCPPMIIDPSKTYIATLKTEKGDIVIELFPDKAPIAVNNFVFLARNGWYDGVTFHRVLQGYIAQAGDPSGTGYGGPGYAFVNEISDLKFDKPGLLAMANAGPDSNGSQFFITFAPAEKLNGGYTIFGRVIAGMENAEKLTPRDPAQSPGLPPGDKILSVVIEEK